MTDELNLREMWAAADLKAKEYRSIGETGLLEKMNDCYRGLKEFGWDEAVYCPKDGTRFLAIEAGSTGVYPCTYQGEWPNGTWWTEAHGDLWPSRPILWKPMPKSKEGML